MSPPPQPAVLIVHGGYFLPSSWAPFITTLEASGFHTICPRLPSCGDTRPPTATLADDITAIRTAASALLAASHPTILLAHSYGGIVASQAITPDLYAPSPAHPGIIHLCYLSGFLVQPAHSLHDVFAKYGFQCKVDVGFNDDGTAWAKNPEESFYNDIDPVRASALARDNVTHTWAVTGGKVTGSPWRDVDTTYVLCTRDLALMLPLQKSMVGDAVEAGGKVTTVEVDSAHCPFLSRPAEVVGIVEKIWEGARRG